MDWKSYNSQSNAASWQGFIERPERCFKGVNNRQNKQPSAVWVKAALARRQQQASGLHGFPPYSDPSAASCLVWAPAVMVQDGAATRSDPCLTLVLQPAREMGPELHGLSETPWYMIVQLWFSGHHLPASVNPIKNFGVESLPLKGKRKSEGCPDLSGRLLKCK